MSIPRHPVPDQPVPHGVDALTSFQIEVIKLFFSIPESKGFLIAGGAGLVAHELSRRPTQDVDFFTCPGRGEVATGRDGLVKEAAERGMTIEILRDLPTYCRMLLTRSSETVLIDLAVDSSPERGESMTRLGPTYTVPELAGRKTIALFGRAAARDFVDVYNLATQFGTDSLLGWAAEVDAGFSIPVFREMLLFVRRFDNSEIPIPSAQVEPMRTFFNSWIDELGTLDHE